MQTPNKHISSAQGCKLCGAIAQGATKAIGIDTMIERFKRKHGDKYEYDMSSYAMTNKPMRIRCSIHGWFEQTPDCHLFSKIGCRRCGIAKAAQAKSYDTSVYIEKAKQIHGDTYSYDLTSFTRSGIKVKIICKEHGVFEQIASNHLNGYGCQSCARNGFNVNSGAHLYVLSSECRSMIKVGVTKDIQQRMVSLASCTPFDFELIAHYCGKGRYVKDDESSYHRELMSCELSGFNGASEWFRYDHDIVERIKKRAEALF
ncbi:hypothetical protein D3C72_1332010 [compost metagenome]